MKMNTADHLWLSALALVALVIGCGTNQPAAAADKNDDVIAIDILLQPDATMLKRAAAINEQLRKDFPKGFSLDASHRPHVSLIQRYVRTGDLDKVYAAVGKGLDSAHVTMPEAGGLQVLLYCGWSSWPSGYCRRVDSGIAEGAAGGG
jgi:hypothetical protein